jgi:hypothetical protein
VALAGPPGGDLHLVWKGVEGDQRIFWGLFPRGGGPFVDRGPVPGANTTVSPALTAAFGQVFMAWKGVGEEQIFRNRLVNGQWTQPLPVAGASTSFAPALATSHPSGLPVMAWKGVTGDPTIWWSAHQGGSPDGGWSGPFQITRFRTSGGVALAGSPQGGMFLAWKGDGGDQRIFWSRQAPGTDNWTDHPEIGFANTSVGPALAFQGNTLHMTWKGVEGDQQIFWGHLPPNASSWTNRGATGLVTSFRPALTTIGN